MSAQKRMIIWEQLALYLTAMPCPPMPLLVTAEVSVEKTDDPSTPTTTRHNANSHDLIAALVLMAMDRGNKALNEQRKEKQLALNEELIHALEALPDDDNGDGAFAACQRFVGGYIHAFDDPGQPTPSVRLAGIDAVERGDKVHGACCSWSAAQDIQHEGDVSKRRTAVAFGGLTFRELLVVHGRRVRAVAPPLLPLPLPLPLPDSSSSSIGPA
jgi:endonuclease YncB( thermonuclease family)